MAAGFKKLSALRYLSWFWKIETNAPIHNYNNNNNSNTNNNNLAVMTIRRQDGSGIRWVQNNETVCSWYKNYFLSLCYNQLTKMSKCFGCKPEPADIGKYILTDEDMADKGRSHSWLRTCFDMKEGAPPMGKDLHRNLVARLAADCVWVSVGGQLTQWVEVSTAIEETRVECVSGRQG